MVTENQNKIRILRVINRFNIGGPIWNVILLTKYLPEDYETKLIGGVPSKEEGDAQSFLELNGVNASIISSMSRKVNFYQDIKTFYKLRSIIKEFRPLIVHTHASKAGFLGRLAAISCGVPIVVHTFHGHVFEGYFNSLKTRVIKCLERWLARHSTAIIAISELQKIALVETHRIAPDSKVHVIPLGFELEKFIPNHQKRQTARNLYNIPPETIAVGIIGRLTVIKNQVMFLKAAAIIIKQKKIEFRFFIVGDGELKEELLALSKKLKIEDHIIFTSWVRRMEEIYPVMDLICLTSFNEGTPVSLIEAQASGIPVISTNVGGVSDIILPKKTGIILHSFEPEELAEHILHLAMESELRIEMSKNAHKFAMEHFSFTKLVSNTDCLYRKIMENENK